MLKSTGHRAWDKPSARTVSCVQCLYSLATEDGARFERLWPLLAELHPDGPMTDAVIRGLWTVDKWLGERSVTEQPYREKLRVIGGQGLHHEIRREMAVSRSTRFCKRWRARYEISGESNVVKFRTHELKVSILAYPGFLSEAA